MIQNLVGIRLSHIKVDLSLSSQLFFWSWLKIFSTIVLENISMYHRQINRMHIVRSISIFRGRNKNSHTVRFVSIIIRIGERIKQFETKSNQSLNLCSGGIQFCRQRRGDKKSGRLYLTSRSREIYLSLTIFWSTGMIFYHRIRERFYVP